MEFNNIKNFDHTSCISGKVTHINRITANIFRKHLLPFNITNSQMTIMFIMSKKRMMTQKELSELIFLEKSTLNRNLKRLLDRKLLDRSVFPKLQITTDGLYFVENIIPVWEKAMKEVSEKLEPEGEHALNTVHTRLI